MDIGKNGKMVGGRLVSEGLRQAINTDRQGLVKLRKWYLYVCNSRLVIGKNAKMVGLSGTTKASREELINVQVLDMHCL